MPEILLVDDQTQALVGLKHASQLSRDFWTLAWALDGPGALSVTGRLNWSGGSLAGPGTTTLASLLMNDNYSSRPATIRITDPSQPLPLSDDN